MDLIWGAISGSNLDLICDGSSRSLVPGRPKQPDERALRRLLQQPAVLWQLERHLLHSRQADSRQQQPGGSSIAAAIQLIRSMLPLE